MEHRAPPENRSVGAGRSGLNQTPNHRIEWVSPIPIVRASRCRTDLRWRCTPTDLVHFLRESRRRPRRQQAVRRPTGRRGGGTAGLPLRGPDRPLRPRLPHSAGNIHHALTGGCPMAALARCRTLHEIAVIMLVLTEFGETGAWPRQVKPIARLRMGGGQAARQRPLQPAAANRPGLRPTSSSRPPPTSAMSARPSATGRDEGNWTPSERPTSTHRHRVDDQQPPAHRRRAPPVDLGQRGTVTAYTASPYLRGLSSHSPGNWCSAATAIAQRPGPGRHGDVEQAAPVPPGHLRHVAATPTPDTKHRSRSGRNPRVRNHAS